MTRDLIARSLLCVLLAATQAHSQDTDRLKPYAGESTVAFIKVDVDRLQPPKFDNGLEAIPDTTQAVSPTADAPFPVV